MGVDDHSGVQSTGSRFMPTDNLVAPGKGEKLIGCGQVLKPGRTLTTCRTEVFVIEKGNKKLCATSLMTLISLPNK